MLASYPRIRMMPVVVLAGLSLAGCSSIGSDGRLTEDPLGNFEQRMIGNTLSGLGIVEAPRQRIDYTPRGPLVRPPPGAAQAGLRPPVNASAEVAQNPNWPRDPDRLREEAARTEATRPRDYQADRERDGRRLTIEEMNAQRDQTRVASRGTAAPGSFQERNVVLSREELEQGWAPPSPGGLFGGIDETVDVTQGRNEGQGAARREIDANSGGPGARSVSSGRIDTSRVAQQQEPPRRSLADPPPGMRAPAADPTGGRVDPTEQRNWWDRLWGR